jgi:GntR family transcriptional regulator
MISTLQKGISAPIYLQLQNLIRDRIADGVWQPGQAIPSEETLVRQFGIARMTVRQALEGLLREGLLIRERGRGTYVARPRVERELTRMHGFSEDMRARGMVPSARLVARDVRPAPAGVSTELRLGKREAVIYLQRLRLADDLPMALESSYLNYELCREVLQADLESGSLYVFLQESIGLRLCYASQELEAAFPNAETAALLEMPRRRPVLIIRQTTYVRIGEEDIPGITGSTVYRADRYRVRMQVPR